MVDLVEIKEIFEKIDVEKEILATMPKNNDKNVEKYLEEIEQLKNTYTELQNQIFKTLYQRYKKAVEIEETDEIEVLNKKLNSIEKFAYLLSDEKTSYEKMGLDRILYKIGRYYKENLENINEQIEKAIKKFSEIGINLDLSDFDYSIYVKQYMQVFFEGKKIGDINSNKIKTEFEHIYWKCPDIIIHIELNIRNIYLKKQPQIDKHFEKEKNNLLKQWNKSQNEIMNLYFDIKRQKEEKLRQDKKLLLESFLNGKLDIKEYMPEKLQNNYSKMLSQTMIQEIETNYEKVEKGVLEFLNSLYEYKKYINFKFIIDDIKMHYEEKEKYKKIYEETKKRISANEKKLRKLNKKALWHSKFGKKEIKQSAEQNQMIEELKREYKQLDLNKFYNKIYTNLNENSTIYEALKLANSYYYYLAMCMIENNKTITQDKIDEQIEKLNEFINNPNNNIINNLTLLDEKDIAMIIKDRYRLLSFNIDKEDFSMKNVESLISILGNIEKSFCLKKTGLEVQEIEEILKIKEVLKIK